MPIAACVAKGATVAAAPPLPRAVACLPSAARAAGAAHSAAAAATTPPVILRIIAPASRSTALAYPAGRAISPRDAQEDGQRPAAGPLAQPRDVRGARSQGRRP